MKFSNSLYDKLKYIALTVLPALATLILAIGDIWGIPYTEAIAATVTAIDTFLGALLKISSENYAIDQKCETTSITFTEGFHDGPKEL